MNPHSMFARRTALALVLFITVFFSIAAQEKSQCNVKVTLLQVNDVYQFAPVDQGKAGGLGTSPDTHKGDQAGEPKHSLSDGRRHDLAVC